MNDAYGPPRAADDEREITEIEFLPDGSVCVFGASAAVIEVLCELTAGRDEGLQRRLAVSQAGLATSPNGYDRWPAEVTRHG